LTVIKSRVPLNGQQFNGVLAAHGKDAWTRPELVFSRLTEDDRFLNHVENCRE
jgi:hypothetical protein